MNLSSLHKTAVGYPMIRISTAILASIAARSVSAFARIGNFDFSLDIAGRHGLFIFLGRLFLLWLCCIFLGHTIPPFSHFSMLRRREFIHVLRMAIRAAAIGGGSYNDFFTSQRRKNNTCRPLHESVFDKGNRSPRCRLRRYCQKPAE